MCREKAWNSYPRYHIESEGKKSLTHDVTLLSGRFEASLGSYCHTLSAADLIDNQNTRRVDAIEPIEAHKSIMPHYCIVLNNKQIRTY